MNQAMIRAALSDIVGDTACLRTDEDVAPFVVDYRRLYFGKCAAVVLPASTDEVSRVMACCHEHDIPVVPQGGNTSLMGGAVPNDNGDAVVLSLKRMKNVIEVDTVNDTMTVQAGVTLQAARLVADRADRHFPLRIGSEGSCQIGGNLATNAGGTAVLRYGNMRDLTLGIEAVLPDGRICSSLRGLRKDNTGYDLKQLFIGSEGTLGIITAAVLKMVPKPKSSSVALVAVPDPANALKLLAEFKAVAGPLTTAFELISAPALELVLEYLGGMTSPFQQRHGWMVLIELTSGGAQAPLDAMLLEVLETGMASGAVNDAVVAKSLVERDRLWHIREEISDAQTRQGGSIKCDVSVPISRIASFIDDATAAALCIDPKSRMIVYGHLGDGNVHFNPLRPRDVPAKSYLARNLHAISTAVDGLADAAGGSISAEHGIGVAKRHDLVKYKSQVEIDLMRQLKRAFDPKNLLNPGKVLVSSR